MIDTVLLRHFVAVADMLSFRRASEKLHISHSVLSRSVSQLEHSLGAKLFDRDSRNVALTDVGEILHREAAAVLRRIEAVSASIRRMADGPKVKLHFGLCETAAALSPRLAKRCRVFKEQYPDVEIVFEMMASGPQASALQTGRLDLGIMQLDRMQAQELGWHVIAKTRMAVTVPDGWRASAEPLRIDELRDWPLILPHPEVSPDAHDQVVALCRAGGFEPRVGGLAKDVLTGRLMVGSGMGAGFFQDIQSAPRPSGSGYQIMQLDKVADHLSTELALAWSESPRSNELQDLIYCLMERE